MSCSPLLSVPSPHSSLQVTRLLVLKPESRLGATDSRPGYSSIKGHPFFQGVDFPTLHLSTPPGGRDGKTTYRHFLFS